MPKEVFAERIDVDKEQRGLGASARASVLWGGGFTLLRDLAQFAIMLILVRLLSPTDYGNAALAQSIIGLVSVVSFGTFVMHALQLRNPAEVDWQAHFSAAAVINSVLFSMTVVIAWVLSFTERYHTVAWPVVGFGVSFLIEIPGTLRHRMLEVRHDWKRFRLLLIIGTFLGMTAGLAIAVLGGGVWALVVQPVLFGVPAVIDLFWHGRWRPDWSWSWSRYRETAKFGANRMGADALSRGRQTVEQTLLAGVYDLATLGLFTRSLGLATVIAGRIGSVVTMSLYPVVTRAEQGSPQFRRYSGLILRGVSWSTVAAAVFVALAAADIVSLLYGSKWRGVESLLPVAAAGVGFAGIAAAVSSMLLANNAIRDCLVLDAVSAAIAIALAFLLVPLGVTIYLAALAVHGAVVLGLALLLLWSKNGISAHGIWTALLPAAIAGVAGVGVVLGARAAFVTDGFLVLRLCLELALYSVAYLLVLRMFFFRPLRELLDVAPGGQRIARLLFT